MHTWKPDAYGEAPALVGTLLAGGVTSCALLALLRLYQICRASPEAAFARELNEATEGGVAKRMREMVEAQYGRSNFVFWSRAWAVAGVVAR